MKQKEIAKQIEGKTIEEVEIENRFPGANDVHVYFEDGSSVEFTVNEPSVWMIGYL